MRIHPSKNLMKMFWKSLELAPDFIYEKNWDFMMKNCLNFQLFFSKPMMHKIMRTIIQKVTTQSNFWALFDLKILQPLREVEKSWANFLKWKIQIVWNILNPAIFVASATVIIQNWIQYNQTFRILKVWDSLFHTRPIVCHLLLC